MSTPNKGRLLRATATALTGAVLAMVCAVAPASAADNPLVDATQKGSITVHKFEKPEAATGLANNGTQLDAAATAALKPLDGVTFSIAQVGGIDLATNEGWKTANDLLGKFDAKDSAGSITGAGHTLSQAVTAVTGSGGKAGEAYFGELGLGLYLVTETVVPNGVTPSAPFLVSVPLTDPNNQKNWLYNVHVYPKNSVSTANKTVADADSVKLGDNVTFTITGGIPNEDILDGYKVVDVRDAKLTYVSTEVALANGAALESGDYTVTTDGNTVTVEFTEPGLAKLAANKTSQVQVVITTTVNTIGEIKNQALVYPNKFSIDSNTSPMETPEVETKWGAITLKKTNKADGEPLAGAKFSVFTTEADAKAGTNPVELGGETVFATPANGELTIAGLRYSNFANGVLVAEGEAGFLNYFLAEVEAPAGFELLAAPIKFQVTQATTAVGVDLDVVNVPSNSGFELPLTGGTGTTLLYAGGLLLVAGAVLLLVRSRRTQS